jgi:hypothetical protein
MGPARLFTQPLRVSVGVGSGGLGCAHGRGVDERRVVLRTPLQQVQRGSRVLPHRARRVGARPGGVGHAGEVQHGVAAGDELARRRIAGVGLDGLQAARGGPVAMPGPRHRDDVVAALGQERRRAPAQEAGCARDEELHAAR